MQKYDNPFKWKDFTELNSISIVVTRSGYSNILLLFEFAIEIKSQAQYYCI